MTAPSPPVDARAADLLAAAGYPTPPTVEDAVRMLLNEIEASKGIADRRYRDGYRLGRSHGLAAGRQDAACELCTYPPDGATS